MSESPATVIVAAPALRKTSRRRGRKPARVTLHGVALHPDVARVVERVLGELQTDESVSAGVVRAIEGLLAGASTYVGTLNETYDYRRLLNKIIREMRKGVLDIQIGEALRRAVKDGHDMRHTERQEEQLAAIHEQLTALRVRPDAPQISASLDALTFAAADIASGNQQE